MSEQHPPAGTPEYLEYGGGAPLPPGQTPPTEAGSGGGRGRRRAWWIGGGVVLLAGLGAGAWAALNFFQQGAQPAEALPSSTVGYLSIDLDPAGGQKIDAFRTLNKFPAFKDEVGVNSVDDIRRKVGDSILEGTHCTNLTYDHDIDPWLGERAAAAVVDVGADKPDFVIVVQVKDEGKARDAFTALNSCDTEEPAAGFVVHDGWAVLAQSQQVADEVSQATDQGTLADDATYQKWTKAVGDAGVVNAYASPAAGRVLAQQLSGLFEGTLIGAGESFTTSSTTTMTATGSGSAATGDDPFTKALSSFKGGAATLRFTGDGLEFALAADGSAGQLSEVTGNDGGALVQRLPDDTAAAAGLTFPKGWMDRQLGQMSSLFGHGMSQDDATRELSRETGFDVPADIETLLGSGVSISVGKDIDLEAAENGDSLSGLPIGVTVKGDPAAIERVLDKIRAKAGNDLGFLGSDSSGDLVAIGPTAAYRQHLLDGGNLGDDDTFRGVVPDAGDGSSVFYVNLDSLEPAITKAAAGDRQTLDNITPLRAMGMSTRNDGGTIKFSFKVTTN
ncbi:DUF3352 domain-containing protein [Nocardioides sp.]|jgi:hypothetical protein|uniref:DUF3352 domain-containing protein n=1 Tax=Nocardioides sp. TaxID=35761 RepID=UPI002F404D45